MATTYERKKQKQHNLRYTIITAIIICAVVFAMVGTFYRMAESNAYEMLHIQTKQIKDDLTLQINSDRENLQTMANFAAKLYQDGEDYGIMFDSFKPIGLISNIGILRQDNTFVTKMGSIDLDGKISFREEARRGGYISGRIEDITREGEEIIRSAVPIKVSGETVGILYGVIHLDKIGEKYVNMAKGLDAQLFVYDKETGKFVIDTLNEAPGQVSDFKDRKYNGSYSYEALVNNVDGFSSFVSKFTDENLYIHYATLEDFGWRIILGRYESQVFEETHNIARYLIFVFALIIAVIVIYINIVMKNEKDRAKLNQESSAIRKLLLEINRQHESINSALQKIKEFSGSRSAFFADTDGEDYCYIKPSLKEKLLKGEDRKYFLGELFRYAANIKADKLTIGFMQIIPNKHLLKTNPELHEFLTAHGIKDVSFAILADKNNHVSILGAINPKKSSLIRRLIGDIAVCFSIAIYNKKHLNRTELAATTDALTGAMNRVAYKKDILLFDEEMAENFACVYIDVNELHIRNNKYGHAAGDEMLIYIANSLKEVFFGNKIYRMDGDEFLVFAKGIEQETVKQKIEAFIGQLETKGYHVAIGMSYRSRNNNCEEMVREAEIRMYEAKAEYYQNKEKISISKDTENYSRIKTGIREIDTLLSVMSEHYNGIYKVSLDTDKAHRILMPAYLGYKEDEESFSALLKKYMHDLVHPDSQRALTSFINYDAIKRQLSEGSVPSISYKKVNGDTVILRVYSLTENTDNVSDTLWVFARD